MSETVLVIAAHPDDEILGCGGAMASHASKGDDVHVVILAEGITSRASRHDRNSAQKELSELAVCAQRANEVLGVRSLKLHDFPDNRMDSVDLLDITKVIEGYIDRLKPSTVYTHHVGDVNVDHRRIHQSCVTACRPQPGHSVKRLLYFEVTSSTEWQTPDSAATFAPNWFINISSTLEKKLQGLSLYSGEMREWPHARSIKAVEHLAPWRGATIGYEAAEAFILGRNIED